MYLVLFVYFIVAVVVDDVVIVVLVAQDYWFSFQIDTSKIWLFEVRHI
jgi:hypothetical protein